jgi:hypothetical protein
MSSLCTHFRQSSPSGRRLLSLVDHGILPSIAKHVLDSFAMWTLPGNARVDQDHVCATDWDKDGKVKLLGWTGLLGTLRSTNGLGGHGAGHLCSWHHSRGSCSPLVPIPAVTACDLHNHHTVKVIELVGSTFWGFLLACFTANGAGVHCGLLFLRVYLHSNVKDSTLCIHQAPLLDTVRPVSASPCRARAGHLGFEQLHKQCLDRLGHFGTLSALQMCGTHVLRRLEQSQCR